MENIKIFIANIKEPSKSQYINPDKVGIFLLGRDILKYKVFLIINGEFKKEIIFEGSDIMKIQKVVDNNLYFYRLEEDE